MSECKHGRRARSCPECDLMADLVDACHALALAEERMREGLTFLEGCQWNESCEETTCHFCDPVWSPAWSAALRRRDGTDRDYPPKVHAADCPLGEFLARAYLAGRGER